MPDGVSQKGFSFTNPSEREPLETVSKGRHLEGDWTNHLSITIYYRLHQEKAFSAIYALPLMKTYIFLIANTPPQKKEPPKMYISLNTLTFSAFLWLKGPSLLVSTDQKSLKLVTNVSCVVFSRCKKMYKKDRIVNLFGTTFPRA